MAHWNLHHWFFGYADSTEAVGYQCLTAVQSVVQALGLTGVSSDDVVVKKLPLVRSVANDGLSYPAIIISPGRPVLPPAAGSNREDDVVYAVGITLLDTDNQERTLAAELNTRLSWIRDIRRAFHNKTLSGVSSVYQCVVEQSDPVWPAGWAANLWVTSLTIRCYSRQNRNN